MPKCWLFTPLTLLFLAGSIGWSQKEVELEKWKAELLKLHQMDRQAHFKTDPDLLLSHHPEEFIAVSQGKVSRRQKLILERRSRHISKTPPITNGTIWNRRSFEFQMMGAWAG